MDSNTKILHVSDQGLPDWRIEKSALSAKKRDLKVYFAGLSDKDPNNTFDWTYNLDWDYKARYHYNYEWTLLKKRLFDIILNLNPDIIHTHDIFAAQLVKEVNNEVLPSRIPFIYDNHEYWSRSIIYQYLQNDTFKQSDPKHASIPNQWRSWELNMINENKIPMLVPSKIIAEELNYFNKDANVFVVPNYPSYEEIKDIPEPEMHNEISSVFTNGGKPYPGNKTPIKNIDGFFDIWNDLNGLGHLHTIGWLERSQDWRTNHGLLSRRKLYDELCKHDLGIIPWKHHPFHPYCSPNRAYEYAHAGLLIVASESLETVFNDMDGMVVSIKNYDDIKETIKLYRDNPGLLLEYRIKTYYHAREHLLWENYEGNIFDAYNKAL